MDPFSSDRDVEHLTAQMKKRVKKFLKACQKAEFAVFITEGKRSKERQLHLWSLGRNVTEKEEKEYLGYDHADIVSRPEMRAVTWTLKSNHLTGEAIDIAFRGSAMYPSDPAVWNGVYDIADSCGLRSIFRDYGVPDKPHLELNHDWVSSSDKKKKTKGTGKKGLKNKTKVVMDVQTEPTSSTRSKKKSSKKKEPTKEIDVAEEVVVLDGSLAREGTLSAEVNENENGIDHDFGLAEADRIKKLHRRRLAFQGRRRLG